MFTVVERSIVYAAVLLAAVWSYRWTRRQSTLLSRAYAAGLLLRAVLGVLLFTISLLQLPVLSSLQLGGGFWTLALDAQSYFHAAETAAVRGVSTVSDAAPSPAFIRALAIWLQAAGVSPASAILFNVLCFIGATLLVVKVARSKYAAVTLVSLALSPALVIFATQALKDTFAVLLTVAAVCGFGVWSTSFAIEHADSRYARATVGTLLLASSVYLIAGIRPYYAVFIVIAAVLGGAVNIVVNAAGSRRVSTAAHCVLFGAVWLAFYAGAGPYYYGYVTNMSGAVQNPAGEVAAFDNARAGFIDSGGATTIGSRVSASASASASASTSASASGSAAWWSLQLMRARLVAEGSALIFVPVSALQFLGVVEFSGGRGLLPITDLDTTIVDGAILAGVLMLLRRRRTLRIMPGVLTFIVVLSAISTLAIGYVVTNFGTLFRLRLMATVPMLIMPAVVVLNETVSNSESRHRQSGQSEPA